MSKYLVIGDLHCRSVWKDIVAKEDYDKVIFLGDYTVPREVRFEDPTDACGFLYDVLDFKDKNPDKVVLLRGNHDCQMLGYYWAHCWPQDHPKVEQYWRTNDVKNWFLKNTQWIYRIPNTNIVCSHAGCSTNFLDNAYKVMEHSGIKYYAGIPVPYSWIIDHLNELEPSELFGFTDDNPFDTNGESKTQPCTWIRPQTLLDYGVKDIVHVVGHTPVGMISNLKDEIAKYEGTESTEIYPDIWCCDCLANNQYLIIEDGIFKPCKL